MGLNWNQIADLKTLEPTYYALLTNTEILGINQDMSPQGRVVRQFPSKAQQAGRGVGGSTIPVSLSVCDEKRASQRWVPGKAAGTVQLDGTTLCLVQNGTTMGIVLAPCNATSTVWGMKNDDTSVHIGTAAAGGGAGGEKSGLCMENPNIQASTTPTLKQCIYDGPIPPVSVFEKNFGSQTYVWGPTTKQVVGGGDGRCLTAGFSNYGGRLGHNGKGGWVTNNGTLEHEVWMGDLTPNKKDGSRRRVVALFNKGASAEALTAPASLYSRDLAGVFAKSTPVKVRDVVNKKDVAVTPGAPIEANVPRHGVSLFILTYPADGARGEL